MLHPEITTFAELWEKLAKYPAFHLYNEARGDEYNAIVEPNHQAQDENTFRFANVNPDEYDFTLSADTKIVELYEMGDSLVFAVQDKHDEDIKHEFFLQARIKPDLS